METYSRAVGAAERDLQRLAASTDCLDDHAGECVDVIAAAAGDLRGAGGESRALRQRIVRVGIPARLGAASVHS